MTNLKNKTNPTHYAVKYEDEVVIMANTREFSGQIEKDTTKDVMNLVLPFILIQLSCQDLYYLNNILNVWMKIMTNPFYFPPKPVKKT